MMSKINWNKINSLFGTGAFSDNTGETDLKNILQKNRWRIFPAKNIALIYNDWWRRWRKNLQSAFKIEFAISAILRNHNENPKYVGSTYRFFT